MTSGKVVTTIGYERRANPALQVEREEAFVRYMTEGQRARPANMPAIIAINHGARPLTMAEPVVYVLTAADVRELVAGDHLVVDIRSSRDFGDGHVPGAFNVQVSNSRFEQRVGWVVPEEPPLLLAAEDRESARAAMHKLAFVGLDARVGGCLMMSAWAAAGLPLEVTPQIDVGAAYESLAAGRLRLLDVREAANWHRGHAEGAFHRELRDMNQLGDALADDGRPVAVICQAGNASSTVSSALQRQGRRVLNVTGGMDAWRDAGLPIVR